MDQGDGYQTVSALGAGQKKIRNAVRCNECGAVLYAVDRKDVHKRRDDERDFRKQTEVPKVIFREWVITMKGVACAYRIYKKGRYIGTFQATGRSGDRDPEKTRQSVRKRKETLQRHVLI